jgi:hypothetical protein
MLTGLLFTSADPEIDIYIKRESSCLEGLLVTSIDKR